MSELDPTHLPTGRAPRTSRLGALRSELEATTDKHRRAVLLYEIAHILEHDAANPHAATREYLLAYNTDPSFRPPLYALVRIFETRGGQKNLDRLYEAEERSAKTPQERLLAILDRAEFRNEVLGEPFPPTSRLAELASRDRAPSAFLLALENRARREGEADLVRWLIDARADATYDPVLRSILLCEAALSDYARGDHANALARAHDASELPANRFRALTLLEWLARKTGDANERIHAIEERALLAESFSAGRQTSDSGLFSLRLFSSEDDAQRIAAALWQRSAHIRLALHDHAGAAVALARAISLDPNEEIYRFERLLVAELDEDWSALEAEARALLERTSSNAIRVLLHFKLAEAAKARGAENDATELVSAALKFAPDSAVLLALRQEALFHSRDMSGLARLFDSLAEQTKENERAELHWRAAVVRRSANIEDEEMFRSFAEAFEHAKDAQLRLSIAREWMNAQAIGGASSASPRASSLARPALEAIATQSPNADERELALFDLWRDTDDADQKERYWGQIAADWTASVDRMVAAKSRDYEKLETAHTRLALHVHADATRAAHWLCAARAAIFAKAPDRAVEHARNALQSRPSGDRFTLTLLEELLIARGESAAAVELLRENSTRADDEKGAELSLLVAGAIAQASGHFDEALHSYEEASRTAKSPRSALFCIRRLAEQTKNDSLLAATQKTLAELEQDEGAAGIETLARAEVADFLRREGAEAGRNYRALLDTPAFSAHAAIGALFLPDAAQNQELMATGLSRLLDAEPSARGDLLWEAHDVLARSGASTTQLQSVWTSLKARGDSLGAAVGVVLGAVDASPSERRVAWSQLYDVVGDTSLKFVAKVHRAAAISHPPLSSGSTPPPSHLDADFLNPEGATDPQERANALGRQVQSMATRPFELDAAYARALSAAGRHAEAIAALRALLSTRQDAGLWDALRTSARAERDWKSLLEACDALAPMCESETKAEFLLEAAAVAMDELSNSTLAQRYLIAALEAHPRSRAAFHRLRDIYAERDQTDDLLELLDRRLENVDDSEELARLYYEQARLFRARGDTQRVLEALENVLMLDERHVGAFALQAELFSSLGDWSQAVGALRSLASCDVPPAQRRLAIVGAADFLSRKLGDPTSALEELERLDSAGLGDEHVRDRIATLRREIDV